MLLRFYVDKNIIKNQLLFKVVQTFPGCPSIGSRQDFTRSTVCIYSYNSNQLQGFHMLSKCILVNLVNILSQKEENENFMYVQNYGTNAWKNASRKLPVKCYY